MKIKSLCAMTLFLSSGLMNANQKITFPLEGIALHNNQILIHQDGNWKCIGGISPDGKGLYVSDPISPCMARCSRIDLEVGYKDFTGRLILYKDDDNDKDNDNENEQQTEQRDPPDTRDHAERDQEE